MKESLVSLVDSTETLALRAAGGERLGVAYRAGICGLAGIFARGTCIPRPWRDAVATAWQALFRAIRRSGLVGQCWRLQLRTIGPAVKILDDLGVARSSRRRTFLLFGQLTRQLDVLCHGRTPGARSCAWANRKSIAKILFLLMYLANLKSESGLMEPAATTRVE